MQFSRTNIHASNANDVDFEAGQAPARQDGQGFEAPAHAGHDAQTCEPPACGAVLDPDALPTWQKAFVIGPNVRFTRTPGQNYAKRDEDDDSAAGAADPQPAVAASSPSAQRPITTSPAVPASPSSAGSMSPPSQTGPATPFAGHILTRGNPAFIPSGQNARTLVGDLERKLAEPAPVATPVATQAPAAITIPGFIMPPRTGAPLKITPRPIPPRTEQVARPAPAVQPAVASPPPTVQPMAVSLQTRTTTQAIPQAMPAAMRMPQPPAGTPAGAAPAAHNTAPAPAAAAHAAPAKPARAPIGIPDHLIWEMMSLGASDGADANRRRAAAPVTASNATALPAQPNPVVQMQVQAPLQAPRRLTAPVTAYVPPRETVAGPTETPAPAVASVPLPVAADITIGPSAIDLYRQIALRQPGASQPATPDPVTEAVMAPSTSAVAAASFPVAQAASLPVAQAASLPVAQAASFPVAQAPASIAAGLQPPPPGATPVAARTTALSPLVHVQTEDYLFPSVELLQPARSGQTGALSQEALEQSAGLLESILEDFGVKGEIIDVRPGPVVTLYEFEPAPGVKSSRVINLADDIARSMSSVSARVAVVPGRNVIGIELPNNERETVYFRELIESGAYVGTDFRLPLCLGKTIGGEPVVAELAKMPHLLVAGTTGSGKSVAINTMILSLIYHLRPEECRLIMVDPKMLELSVYDGIPHLLTPVVTDPKKAVLALKWAVREMEERYRKMSRLGVRNIDGFNARVAEARNKGEQIMLSVPVGFDKGTGEQIFEEQQLDLTALPYIVVIVDEMADLMMVAGKEIEGAIQRLAQMARAAGIHLIMATQRPSVDVITGTIKANFPTRISFQVTSKIDSRTILGEQGAENLLGQGDMLHMKGGGRIARVHGPFVADSEVEKVVAHLKTQGQPSYLGSVTEDEDDDSEVEEDSAVFDNTAMGAASGSGDEEGDDLYERAIKIVQRDKKCSTSYIQRRLSIGYNRAASLVERMEKDGLVGPANHVGKREILEPRIQHAVEDQHEE
ncbi:DNA translocase FtsK [Rhizobium halophytocola]|uniref:S-DNA-T family DNA segregation ATPase FtsK/SpoIIIE n=1 Tax=Rhizobium halophytocola TaxID=735519 RepID=A0ABS4DVF8_9HYPH|nr:DNA translocase FtsK [Rhizobium halophytocola]MBP1849677.1 S-DNA-T family DNA segregation ATPase FtsK/SpoIIIE [Rhizobium halophytocola]